MAEKEKKMPEEPMVDQTAEETAENPSTAEQPGQEEIKALQTENEELKNKLLRQMAEFDNYKKRTAKEKDEL
ncbi:MAG: nucleotide exchange factor GrpE, partial [Clostridiales bacterium]|nr:nucleotide exchange factor GrpE [Clostridiales bacterium]